MGYFKDVVEAAVEQDERCSLCQALLYDRYHHIGGPDCIARQRRLEQPDWQTLQRWARKAVLPYVKGGHLPGRRAGLGLLVPGWLWTLCSVIGATPLLPRVLERVAADATLAAHLDATARLGGKNAARDACIQLRDEVRKEGENDGNATK